jgi:ATPase subunit of ABC transporter with duplicated ATPase domains
VLLITHDRVLADAWCEEIADIRELSASPAPAYSAPAASSASARRRDRVSRWSTSSSRRS